MAEVYNPLYFSLVKSLYDNGAVDNQFVANLTETGHRFQISAAGFQEITGISWIVWQAQHNPTTDAPTTDAPTTDAPTTDAPTTDAPTTDAPATDAPATTQVTSQTPDSKDVIQ